MPNLLPIILKVQQFVKRLHTSITCDLTFCAGGSFYKKKEEVVFTFSSKHFHTLQ